MSATAVCEPPVATRLTLGELLTRAHEAGHAHGTAECPVCGGTLAANVADASCDDCGSRLS
jgi:hypothetical protein